MGLIISEYKDEKTGVLVNNAYLNINKIDLDNKNKKLKILCDIYSSKESRDSAKQPLNKIVFTIENNITRLYNRNELTDELILIGTEDKNDFSAFVFQDKNIFVTCYDFIKTKIPNCLDS